MNIEEKKRLIRKLQREVEKEEHPPTGIEGELVWCDLHRGYYNVWYGCIYCRPDY